MSRQITICISEKIKEMMKIILYIWVNSCYDNQAGLGQMIFLCPLLSCGRNPERDFH